MSGEAPWCMASVIHVVHIPNIIMPPVDRGLLKWFEKHTRHSYWRIHYLYSWWHRMQAQQPVIITLLDHFEFTLSSPWLKFLWLMYNIVWHRGSSCCSHSCKLFNLLRKNVFIEKTQYNMMSWRLLLLLTSNLDMHACLKSRYACVSRFEVSNKMAPIKARRIVYWIKKYEHIRRFPLTELIVYQTTFSLFIITLPQCVFVIMTWTW